MDDAIRFRIAELEIALNEVKNNFNAMGEIFIRHCNTNFVDKYVHDELLALTKGGECNYNPIRLPDQMGINFINTNMFDYSVTLLGSKIVQNNIKWMGIDQVLMIKGRGRLKIQILKLPPDVNINFFEEGIEYEVVEEKEMSPGDSISCIGPQEFIYIVEVSSYVIIESLIVKNENTNLFWNFDEKRKSYLPESSKCLTSQIINILDLSKSMDYEIQPEILHKLFEFDNPTIKVRIIEKLLLEESYAELGYLEKALKLIKTNWTG